MTVAERLSEDPSLSIAVIEAGSFYELDNGNLSQIPAFYAKNFNQTPVADTIQPLIDWGDILEPQTGLGGRRFHYSQGKTLGGSSGRNSNIFTRGTVGWFKRVANAVGDPSWEWDNVLPYYKKSVQFTPPNQEKIGQGNEITFDPGAYGPGGPLQVTYSNYYQPMNRGLIKGFTDLGFKALQDLVSGTMIGWGYIAVTIDPATQLKDSSETAFLQTALGNSTLKVYKNTYAKKIVFDNSKRATAVQVETGGLSYTLEAVKEVIVSAGVTRSPQVLMVSGVGPASILQQHNIPVVQDLQVGQNWQDHCAFEFQYKMNVGGNAALEGDKQYLYESTEQFITSQEGPLTNWGGDILGFEKLPEPYRSALDNNTLRDLAAFGDEPEYEFLTASHGPQMATESYVTFTPAILTVISKGTIDLISADTADNPKIDPKSFQSPTELKLGIQMYKRMQEFINATGLTEGPELKAGPATTDEEILKALQTTGLPWYHGVGSCKIFLRFFQRW